MAEFKESETRRVVEGGALSEQTALEWIGERAEDELFREAGAMRCGKKGTVSIFECTSAYRDALQHVEDGLKLQGACAPLRRAVERECGAGGGCCVLRRFPLGGDEGAAWRTLALCEALGRTVAQDAEADAVALPKRVARSAALGNDAPIPDCAVDLIVISCARPFKSPRALHLATCDALLRGVSLDAKGTLRRPMNYACDPVRPEWRRGGGDRTTGSQPCLGQDDDFRKTLRFSAALKANVEWCDDAAADAIEALAEVEAAAATARFPFDLKEDDVLVVDAARWLFAVDVPPDGAADDGLAWARGQWMPKRAIRPDPEDAPTDPLVLKAWVAKRAAPAAPPSAAPAPPVAPTAEDDDADARWLADLVKAELKVQQQ